MQLKSVEVHRGGAGATALGATTLKVGPWGGGLLGRRRSAGVAVAELSVLSDLQGGRVARRQAVPL